MDFTTLIKTKKDEGKEKHVPHVEIDKGHKSGHDIVRVVVGHGESHPNTIEHHIAWIELYGVKKDNGQVINLGRALSVPLSFPIRIFDFRSIRSKIFRPFMPWPIAISMGSGQTH